MPAAKLPYRLTDSFQKEKEGDVSFSFLYSGNDDISVKQRHYFLQALNKAGWDISVAHPERDTNPSHLVVYVDIIKVDMQG